MPDTAPAPPFPDYRFAPNIGGHPDVYEIENRALDRAGHVLDAMRALAPWAGKTIVDLGCGTGFWLPGYAGQAARVIGIEPDPAVRAGPRPGSATCPAPRSGRAQPSTPGCPPIAPTWCTPASPTSSRPAPTPA